MPVEYILDVVFAFGVLSAFVVLAMCYRDILPKVSTDKLLQSIEQEEIKFDEAVQKLPDNVIELNMLCRTDPYKDFVEEFLIFETVRNHKGMFDYATNRTRMIRKARRLLGQ